MDDLFLIKFIIQIVSVVLSFFLVLIGVLSLIKRQNRRRPSCIYFTFLTSYYFLYRCLDFFQVYRLSTEYIISIYSSLLLISSLLFINLYEVAHLQEEVGDRIESKTTSQTNRRQNQFKISNRLFKSSLYLIILSVFVTIGLDSTLQNNLISLINILFVLLITLGISIGCRKLSKKSKNLHTYFILFVISNFISFLFMMLYNDVKIYLYFGNDVYQKTIIVLIEAITISFRIFSEISLIPLLIYKLRRIEK